MHKFNADQVDYFKTLDSKAIDALLLAATQRLQEAVLNCHIETLNDTGLLAARKCELQGARKLVASVNAMVAEIKKRPE